MREEVVDREKRELCVNSDDALLLQFLQQPTSLLTPHSLLSPPTAAGATLSTYSGTPPSSSTCKIGTATLLDSLLTLYVLGPPGVMSSTCTIGL